MLTKLSHLIMTSECLIFLFLVTRGCVCTELKDKAFRSLVRLCPAQYITSDNNIRSSLNLTSDNASCCTDNFTSSPNGGIVTNRPDLSNLSGNGQRCLFPSIETNPSQWFMKRSYYMITREPDEGCIATAVDTQSSLNDSSTLPKATCDDSKVIPFRRFLPSFSPSSGFIYKNPHCAYCHGRYDVKIWKQRAKCPISKAFSYDCDLYFSYPGNFMDLEHLQCFTEAFTTCPTTFSVENMKHPPAFDLSTKEVFEACSLDNLPRFDYYLYSSKNVFCYICQVCHMGLNCLKGDCPTLRFEETKWNKKKSFMRIINTSVSPSISAQDLSRSWRDSVLCESDEKDKECHAELCPLGQVTTFSGDKIVCKMDSSRWITERFAVLLALEFDGRIDTRKFDLKSMFARGQVKSPWRKEWRIHSVYMPVYRSVNMTNISQTHLLYKITKRQPMNSTTQLYVEMSYVHNEVNPEELMRDIRETLQKHWYLNTGDETIVATQSFSRFGFQFIVDSDNQQHLVVPSWQLNSDVSPLERFVYEPIVRQLYSKAYYITKLMICKQIEIPMVYFNKTDIITFQSVIVALHYNRTSNVLFDGEFYKQGKSIDEESIRICISDSGLTLRSSCYLYMFSPSVSTLLLVCIWIALLTYLLTYS